MKREEIKLKRERDLMQIFQKSCIKTQIVVGIRKVRYK